MRIKTKVTQHHPRSANLRKSAFPSYAEIESKVVQKKKVPYQIQLQTLKNKIIKIKSENNFDEEHFTIKETLLNLQHNSPFNKMDDIAQENQDQLIWDMHPNPNLENKSSSQSSNLKKVKRQNESLNCYIE